MKKTLAGFLALLTVFALFGTSLVSCDEQTVSGVLDAALSLADNLPGTEKSTGDDGGLYLIEPDEPEAIAEAQEPDPAQTEAPAPDPAAQTPEPEAQAPETEAPPPIDENGTYDDKEHVALYIHTYGKLPSNYITKKEAEALGWTGGSLERYAPGKCLGGTYFGNYEGLLPKKKGREYHECDIGTIGKSSRGAKRIVYSNDGLIYYTEDHYETFELLYGGD